jgi:glutathione S-transferase
MSHDDLPVLWQLELSHYNEKARWALDYKRIPHRRRALLPGFHLLIAAHLTGGAVQTTPVLTLEGRSIGDSTDIIAALEARWPRPSLYPEDPQQRVRALELEEYFDEELGPHVRRAIYYELLQLPELLVPLLTRGRPRPIRLLLRAAFPLLAALMRRRFNVTAEAALDSRRRTAAAMVRIERELGPGGYLVGDRFTVADLTAAALLYPVVRPPEFPYPTVNDPPGEAGRFLHQLAQLPAGRWVAEMYARHRAPAGTAAVSAFASATAAGAW